MPATGQRGQALVEYALILVLAVVVIALAVPLLGPGIKNAYCSTIASLRGGADSCATGPKEDGAAPLYDNDLGKGFDDWELVDGKKWEIRGGQLCEGPGGEHQAFAGDTSWTDYTVHTSATLDKGNGYGVFFRSQGTTALA